MNKKTFLIWQEFFNSDFINYALIILLIIASISIWNTFNNREKIIISKEYNEQFEILKMQKVIVSIVFISLLIIIPIFIMKFIF